MSLMLQQYQSEIAPKLREELGLDNVHQVPKITKIVINTGLGRAAGDNRVIEAATTTLRKITGQEPISTIAKHSIAGFKLREGMKIGLKVTLRGERMYDFLDRLVNLVLPRTRDFRGLSAQAFDPDGNYSLGIKDQTIFPELTYEETTVTHGLQVNIITNTKDAEASKKLLAALGFPFERKD